MRPEILLVEDEPDDAELFRLAAREAGIAEPIRVANDGEQALELLRERKVTPLAVFLDLNMPGLGGFETLRRLKTLAPFDGLLIAVLSSSDREEDQASVRRLGFELYFVKPKTFAAYLELAARIKSLLPAPTENS